MDAPDTSGDYLNPWKPGNALAVRLIYLLQSREAASDSCFDLRGVCVHAISSRRATIAHAAVSFAQRLNDGTAAKLADADC